MCIALKSQHIQKIFSFLPHVMCVCVSGLQLRRTVTVTCPRPLEMMQHTEGQRWLRGELISGGLHVLMFVCNHSFLECNLILSLGVTAGRPLAQFPAFTCRGTVSQCNHPANTAKEGGGGGQGIVGEGRTEGRKKGGKIEEEEEGIERMERVYRKGGGES